jgi:hypothetical protein
MLSRDGGVHTGKIYSASGSLIASQAFSGETASGWQTVMLATPLPISANTPYVVSVTTGSNRYVASPSGLAAQVVNKNLGSIVGGNGVFGPVAAILSQSWQTCNYFRDALLPPGPPPSPDTVASTVPKNLQATTL